MKRVELELGILSFEQRRVSRNTRSCKRPAGKDCEEAMDRVLGSYYNGRVR
jgi:hypothetical protein